MKARVTFKTEFIAFGWASRTLGSRSVCADTLPWLAAAVSHLIAVIADEANFRVMLVTSGTDSGDAIVTGTDIFYAHTLF